MKVNFLPSVSYNPKSNQQNPINRSNYSPTFKAVGEYLRKTAFELFDAEYDLLSKEYHLSGLKSRLIVFNRADKIDAAEKIVAELKGKVRRLTQSFQNYGGTTKIKEDLSSEWSDRRFPEYDPSDHYLPESNIYDHCGPI